MKAWFIYLLLKRRNLLSVSIIIISFICILTSCNSSGESKSKKTEKQVVDKTQEVNKQVSKVKEKRKEYSAINAAKFPYQNILEFTPPKEKFHALPDLKGVSSYVGLEAKYYSNQTFSKNFNSFVIGLDEGGDCWAGLMLLNCKDDQFIASHAIANLCEWENGITETSTKFKSDSVFVTTTISKGKSVDKNGIPLPNSTSVQSKIASFLINYKGEIKLLSQSDSSWMIDKPLRN